MRVETIQYDDVPEDGVINEGALIPVDGKTWLSPPDGGCGIPECPCFRGHFFLRLFPRDTDGTVFGYIVEFDTRAELEETGEDQIVLAARQVMN